MSDPRDSQTMRGAVDLSALQRQSAPPRTAAAADGGGDGAGTPNGAAGGPGGAGAGTPGSGPGGAVKVDVTEATFQTEVLERSMTTPVVVDFWAEWCQPCKQLSPLLEKLAVEYGGAWVLAQVDVDANPRLAQMFRVQGIPMVYAVVGGQPVDAFTGVVPEEQLRQWLDAVLKAGGVSAPEAPENPRLTEAEEALANGDLDAAEQAFTQLRSESPGDQTAEAGLAQVALLRRVQQVDPAQALAAADAAPTDVEAQTRAADVEMLQGNAEQAYQRLVTLVRRTTGDDRDRARDHLVSLFALADPDDPAVASARRALASALF